MDASVLQSYLDPKMLIVIVVLWVIGSLLKRSSVPDKWIVWILTFVSLTYAMLIMGFNVQGLVQGVIAVGVSVYGHQIVKQTKE